MDGRRRGTLADEEKEETNMSLLRTRVKPSKCPSCGEMAVFHGLIDKDTLGEKCGSCGWTKESAKISIALKPKRKLRKKKKKKRVATLPNDEFSDPDEHLWPP